MTSLPNDNASNAPEGHKEGWIAEDHARSLAAASERLRMELEQARAEHARAMAESEGRYWALAESLQDILIVLDASDAPATVTGDTMGILGYTHAEIKALGPSLWERLVHPRELSTVRACLQRVRRDEMPQRLLARARDRADEYRWLEVSVSPVDLGEDAIGLQVMARDVSDRVQNERMLASLNAAAEVVQRAAITPDSVLDSVVSQLHSLGFTAAVGLLDDDGQRLRFVRLAGPEKLVHGAQRLTGITMSEARIPVDDVGAFCRAIRAREVVHLTIDEAFLYEVFPDPVKGLARAVARTISPLRAVIAPLVADDRVLGLLGVAGESLRDSSVSAVALFASQTSIALRNAQLMDRIRESEQRYRGIFEATTDALLVVDEAGRILEANPAACATVGYDRDALTGMEAEALLADEARARFADFFQGVMRGEQVSIEAELLCRDANTLPAEVHGAILTLHDAPRLLLVFHDMSEQVRAQQALVRSEKLDVLGQMAAGVAHDFNNILVSIRGYADVALMDLTSHPEMVRSDIEHILTGAGDATEAIRRLQSLYRQVDDTSDFAQVHLTQLVTESLALTQPQWKDQPQSRGVTIEVERDLRDTPPILGNASELRRVLANLIVNAIDAMPEGGTLTLTTGETDGWCYVRVSDTGAGIAPEQAEHIFEPFFTTKGGKGSGLGLTVSQNIVKRHGGAIQLDGAPTRGAAFTVRLPVAAADSAPAAEQPGEHAAVRIRPGLRVLIVDDEASVRLLLARLLTRDGYIVHEAPGGKEAIALLRTHPFDLLITDLGMPGVSGHQVAQHARQARPAMPIILSTGWGETISPDQLDTLGAAALLAKPFTYDDLIRAMGVALSR